MSDNKHSDNRISAGAFGRLKVIAGSVSSAAKSIARRPAVEKKKCLPFEERKVGVIFSTDSPLANATIRRGVERVIRANGYEPVFMITRDSQARELRGLRELYTMNVKGIIVEPSMSQMLCRHKSFYDKLSHEGVPYVFIHSTYPQMNESPLITTDDSHGTYLLTRHLIATGRRRIAAFFSSDDSRGYQRHAGYVNALQEAGIRYDPSLVIWFHTEDKKKRPVMDIENILRTENGCDSVMCYSDEMADEIIKWLYDNGYSVPGDISVTGYGNTRTAGAEEIGLTTVALQEELLGLFAAELLIEKFKGVNDSASTVERVLAPELIIRGSSITTKK